MCYPHSTLPLHQGGSRPLELQMPGALRSLCRGGREEEGLGDMEARPRLWCARKDLLWPGLGTGPSSCRADLSKTFFMPQKSQTSL